MSNLRSGSGSDDDPIQHSQSRRSGYEDNLPLVPLERGLNTVELASSRSSSNRRGSTPRLGEREGSTTRGSRATRPAVPPHDGQGPSHSNGRSANIVPPHAPSSQQVIFNAVKTFNC